MARPALLNTALVHRQNRLQLETPAAGQPPRACAQRADDEKDDFREARLPLTIRAIPVWHSDGTDDDSRAVCLIRRGAREVAIALQIYRRMDPAATAVGSSGADELTAGGGRPVDTEASV